MKRTLHGALVLIAACLSVSVPCGKAVAAPLTRISWTITSGTLFDLENPGNQGTPITGGSVVYALSSPLSTSSIMPTLTPDAGSLRLMIETGGSNVTLTFRSLIATITPSYAALGGPYPINGPGSFVSVFANAVSVFTVFSLENEDLASSRRFVATLGQEVRSASVPEPSSAVLVALGLLVLASTAGARERRSRSSAS